MTEREQRVTPLELFFDLVLVFAITQVTRLMSDDPTWHGLGRGLLVLAALWWSWTGYAWLTNTLEPEEGIVRAGMFAAMAAMLIVALAVLQAFDADAVLFGVAYLIVRLLHLAALRDRPTFGPCFAGAGRDTGLLIVAAGFFDALRPHSGSSPSRSTTWASWSGACRAGAYHRRTSRSATV